MNAAALRDSLKSFIRVWVLTTLGLFIPGLLGWTHDLTDWAKSNGTTPFPDAHGLAFLLVAAVSGAFPAALAAILRLVENGTGTNLLPRPAGPQPPPVVPPNDGGTVALLLLGPLLGLAGVLLAMTGATLLGVIVLAVGVLVAALAVLPHRWRPVSP